MANTVELDHLARFVEGEELLIAINTSADHASNFDIGLQLFLHHEDWPWPPLSPQAQTLILTLILTPKLTLNLTLILALTRGASRVSKQMLNHNRSRG